MGKNSKLVLLPVFIVLAAFMPFLFFIFPAVFFLFLVLYSRASPLSAPLYCSFTPFLPSFRSPPR